MKRLAEYGGHVAAILIAGVHLTACESRDGPARPVEAIVGRTALTIGLPDGFTMTRTAEAIVVRPRGDEDRRISYVMEVSPAPASDPIAGPQATRSVAGRTVAYRLVRAAGGSGGEEVRMTADMPCATGKVRLTLTTQAENGETPDLSPAWAVLSRAACRPAPIRRGPGPAPDQDQPTISSGLKK